jgi:hypothetical protein
MIPGMLKLATLLVIALLGVSVCACGSSSPKAGATTAQVGTDSTSTHKNDRDNDGDHNDDDQNVLGFGHVADVSDTQVITTIVTHYYAAAATENGKAACALMAPFIAESVAEQDGHSPALHGSTCAVVMAKLFKLHHRELAGKNASLKVMRIGVEGDKSLVALEFPEIPEVRQVTLRQVGSNWGLITLLDGILE